jgi:hypothetical protein
MELMILSVIFVKILIKMTQLSISIPDEKLDFIIELLKNLGFVKIESIDGKSCDMELSQAKNKSFNPV